MISATVICDSISPDGIRLTTLNLKYPRFFHSQLLTHRKFSRNASSSRAIPVERLINSVLSETAIPIHWGANQPGMQAANELTAPVEIDGKLYTNIGAWNVARDNAVKVANAFAKAGYHKQLVNRILEPFAHINVLVSSTEWDNFFSLRNHADAQPEIEILAKEIINALTTSEPKAFGYYDWHLPFITDEEKDIYNEETLKKISVARCASVSYKTVDGQPMTVERAIAIFDKLYTAKPFHASPFEHIARPLASSLNERLTGNFDGWIQYRKLLEEQQNV